MLNNWGKYFSINQIFNSSPETTIFCGGEGESVTQAAYPHCTNKVELYAFRIYLEQNNFWIHPNTKVYIYIYTAGKVNF